MVDLVLALFFVYLFINGVYRGFFNIFIRLSGFFIGVFLGYLLYKPFSIFLKNFFSGNILALDFLSFTFIVLIVLGFSIIVEKILKKHLYSIKYVKLSDRILGGVLSIVGFIFITFILSDIKNKNKVLNILISNSKIVQTIDKFKAN